MLVRLSVFNAHVAPVALCVPLEELDGRLTGLLQSFESAGRGDDLAER
ncbi:MAG TPA: hypothetical protein VMR25_01305 [Planctomycetaceae bacterium]|nr:hypothetical protein [Planctomycetaceae bacterium]